MLGLNNVIMNLDITFFLNSLLLGLGLAMDAFSVSLANGLCNQKIKFPKAMGIASTFGFFQFLMPFIGWVLVSTVAKYFGFIEVAIPYIALILLAFIGGKMIYEGVKKKDEKEECPLKPLTFGLLIVQGIATSIDALSVGFTIAHYNVFEALLSAGIIGILTIGICLAGVYIGKAIGTKFQNKASIFGGVILIMIGLEIFITNAIL